MNTSLILTALPFLREIQVRTSSTRLCVYQIHSEPLCEEGGSLEGIQMLPAVNNSQKNLMLELTKFGATVENAFEEKAPHKICAYIYEVSNAFNSFYHETKILSEEDQAQKESFLKLLDVTKGILRPVLIFWDFPHRIVCKTLQRFIFLISARVLRLMPSLLAVFSCIKILNRF